jgi:hypothetical protein
MTKRRVIQGGQRVSLTVFLAMMMVAVSFVWLELTVQAGYRGKGPGCGGTLLDGDEQNGDIILLLNSGGGSWDSGGPTITKSLEIEGGWKLKSGSTCSSSTVYTDTSNFEFVGPITRSTANESGALPVMTVDLNGLTLTVKHVIFDQNGFAPEGGGINGVISNSAILLLENVAFIDNLASANRGAGMHLEVRGNSRLVISGSQFMTNTAQDTGGGFEIEVYDGSQVIINNSQFFNNRALNGNGGGGRILIDRGTVTIGDSVFSGNLGNQGRGGGLSVEATGSGPAYLILQNTVISGNTASFGDDDLHISGNVTVLDKLIFLPIVVKGS